jgi:long-chain fatty acid transport protein
MRSRKTLTVFAVLGAIAALALPWNVLGLGSRIPNQDAAAIGRGNAFVATADNPSAMYYNPAGITQLEGHNLQVGSLFYLNIYADYKSPGGGTQVDNETDILPVPQIHYAYSPTNLPVAFGLGVYAPFGLGMKWPADAPFRTSGIEAQLTHLTINPVIAWKPWKTLSLAAGPTFSYGRAKLRQGLLPAPATQQYEFTGYGWAYGFNAGLLWQPLPKWSLGAKYFSASTMAYEGEGTADAPFGVISGPTTTHLDFPQIIVAGISFRPTTNWNFEFNVDWTDWNTTDLATIDGVGALPLYWNSSFFYEIGATRELGKGYYVSAGYFFSEASTPEAFYTPLVPDTDLHVGSLGVGYRGANWSWALAGQLIGGPYRDIDNQVVDPSVNGSYRLFTPTISFSVGYRF